jgi:HPt (histidine-containing phosphotransfer) domain-containing protein
MSSPLILDPEAIANLRALSPDDDDGFLREILGIFLEDTPMRIAELHASRNNGDAASFTRAAHSIKGSSSNVGALELRAAAERLEAHAKQAGITGADTLLAAVEAAFARVEPELRKLAG